MDDLCSKSCQDLMTDSVGIKYADMELRVSSALLISKTLSSPSTSMILFTE
jgi:hypothetical protein